MMFGAAAAAESALQADASTQAMLGLGSLTNNSQISSAALSGAIGGLLAAQQAANVGLFGLGLGGPAPGVTPLNLAYNGQYTNVTLALIGQLAGIGAAQSQLALGSSAMLANAGRRFLLSTYYGGI